MAHGTLPMTAVSFRRPRLAKGTLWQKFRRTFKALFGGE